jgi:hypothetical protein
MGFLNWAVMIAPTFAALWNPRHPNHDHITSVFDRLWKPVVLPPMAGGSGQGRQFQAARFQETLLHLASLLIWRALYSTFIYSIRTTLPTICLLWLLPPQSPL